MKCDHIYGYAIYPGELVTAESYDIYNKDTITKFPYCPYCRTQVHTIDAEMVPLGLPKDDEDCIRGGCED